MTNTETTLQTFDFAGLELRVIMHMAEPWFVAGDVLDVLGCAKGSRHNWLLKLAADEKGKQPVLTHGGSQLMLTISESGLYKLIMRSDKPEACKFQDWVTREVLPAIRKTGGYLQLLASTSLKTASRLS